MDENRRLNVYIGTDEARALYLVLRRLGADLPPELCRFAGDLEDFVYSGLSIEEAEALLKSAETGDPS